MRLDIGDRLDRLDPTTMRENFRIVQRWMADRANRITLTSTAIGAGAILGARLRPELDRPAVAFPPGQFSSCLWGIESSDYWFSGTIRTTLWVGSDGTSTNDWDLILRITPGYDGLTSATTAAATASESVTPSGTAIQQKTYTFTAEFTIINTYESLDFRLDRDGSNEAPANPDSLLLFGVRHVYIPTVL